MNELIEKGLVQRTLRKKPGNRKYNDKSIFRIIGTLPRYAPDTSDDSLEGEMHKIAAEVEDLTKEQFLEKCEAAYNKAMGLLVGHDFPRCGQDSRASCFSNITLIGNSGEKEVINENPKPEIQDQVMEDSVTKTESEVKTESVTKTEVIKNGCR